VEKFGDAVVVVVIFLRGGRREIGLVVGWVVEVFSMNDCSKVSSGPGYTCARGASSIDDTSDVGLLS
jgi:hypothetical protein